MEASNVFLSALADGGQDGVWAVKVCPGNGEESSRSAMRRLPFPGVFKPPSDSFMLVDQLRREPGLPGASVLDLCAGSGVLGIAAALLGAAHVTAIDVSRRAVIAARLNGLLNGVRVNGLRGDLFAPLAGRRFDFIVSNPPYLPSADDQLPRRGPARAWEAGPGGRAFLDPICQAAPAHLAPGGVLLLVHSSLCGETETTEALRAAGLDVTVPGRHRGPLGERLSARAEVLRARGLLPDAEVEDILIVRAARP